MITLLKPKRIENKIFVNVIFPQRDKEEPFHVVYDIEKGEIVESKYKGKDMMEEIVYGMAHVITACEQMVEYNNYPEKANVMWY